MWHEEVREGLKDDVHVSSIDISVDSCAIQYKGTDLG